MRRAHSRGASPGRMATRLNRTLYWGCIHSSPLAYTSFRTSTTSTATKGEEVPAGADNVAQLFIQLLEKRGVPVLFANSGTDFTPLIDGLARYGMQTPSRFSINHRWLCLFCCFLSGDRLKMKVVLGTHENTVVSMAHGYSLVSGKLTALMNHVTVNYLPFLFFQGNSF